MEKIETAHGPRIFHDVEQNTPAWYELRSGIPTASGAKKIVTSAKLEPSASQEGFINHLIAERMAGHVLEFQSDAMREGHDREPESRKVFELTTGMKVKPGGFWTTEDGRFGASPDGLIERMKETIPGEGLTQFGILELKNPNASTHIGYLRNKAVEREYWVQIISQLYVTGADFAMIQSYYPDLPSVIITVERDEKAIEILATNINSFCDRLDAEWQKLNA